MKVSVLTITYRPGYIDSIVESLLSQTMSKLDFELVLVDDLWEMRRDQVAKYIQGQLQYQHFPSTGSREVSATATAINAGLAACRGELVYFLADYCYPSAITLERHWQLYQEYGPDVIISGRLLDACNYHGFVHQNAVYPVMMPRTIGEHVVLVREWAPPIDMPMVVEYQQPSTNNLISIWESRFRPHWPPIQVPDWRFRWTAQKELAPDLHENTPGHPQWENFNRWSWFWCGRNDSAPLNLLKRAGGLHEPGQEVHGGLDGMLAAKMAEVSPKLRYLIDGRSQVIILPHPFRKQEVS